MSDTTFYKLKVAAVEPETAQASTITFDIPEGQKELFQYAQGQYLTLKFDINGKELRRAYSLCSSPFIDAKPMIGVKRVVNGIVSNHINDSVKVGQEIDVMPPQGNFTTEINPEVAKDYFLVCGGSGITPIYSIIKSVVEREPKSCVHLIYGNMNEDSIMFKDQIDQLEQKYKGQLTVTHVLEKPNERKEGGFLGMFAKKIVDWEGLKGRIGAKLIKSIYNEKRDPSKGIECFLCGPAGLMRTGEDTFKSLEIDEKHIHAEWFSTEPVSKEGAITNDGAKAIVQLNGKKIEVNLLPNETILDGLLRIDEDPPYSCMSGACSTCVCKIKSGHAEMERCLALSDDEVTNGYLLSCSAIPTTDVIEISYDE